MAHHFLVRRHIHRTPAPAGYTTQVRPSLKIRRRSSAETMDFSFCTPPRTVLFSCARLTRYGITSSTGPNGTYLYACAPASRLCSFHRPAHYSWCLCQVHIAAWCLPCFRQPAREKRKQLAVKCRHLTQKKRSLSGPQQTARQMCWANEEQGDTRW